MNANSPLHFTPICRSSIQVQPRTSYLTSRPIYYKESPLAIQRSILRWHTANSFRKRSTLIFRLPGP